MEKNVYRKLLNKVKNIEAQQSLENFVKNSTNFDDEHRLRIEEDYSSTFQDMSQVYENLRELELADLLDFQKIYGRFDGDNY